MTERQIYDLASRLNAVPADDYPYYTMVALMEIALQLARMNESKPDPLAP